MSPEEQANTAAINAATASPEPTRRLSWWRVAGVLAVLCAAVATLVAFTPRGGRPVAIPPATAFAPYVDITATPQFAFEDPTEVTAGSVVLAFVVSPTGTGSTGSTGGTAACEPSWGGVYSLDAAMSGIDLDRRIARLQQRGGRVTVSFGGAANSELAVGCTDTSRLAEAYLSVVSRYSPTGVDLDIESGEASSDAVNARRATAIKEVQQGRAAAGHPLAVWLTLPVSRDGLTERGRAVLESMLTAKVDLAGVNAMTMDYPQPTPNATMAAISIDALTAVQRQVTDAYRAAGHLLNPEEAWQKVGATPMIGQNDITDQRFELTDAQALLDFAKQRGLLRLSMWSANRDQACGINYANPEVVSDECSGVNQQPGAYSAILGGFATPVGPSARPRPTGSGASSSGPADMKDDPATSPYPIWNALGQYPKSTKVVWHRNVYEAKWWSQGDVPDAPVTDPNSTPWVLIGPVLPGEKPAPLPTLSDGTYPEWTGSQVYVAGQRVMLDGVGYQAKWWTQGQRPVANPLQPSDTPWQLIKTP